MQKMNTFIYFYVSSDSYSETEDLTTLITQTIKPEDDDYGA